jgi:membrane-bound metal-dependent hydrolase YbcI (DUF457 family)
MPLDIAVGIFLAIGFGKFFHQEIAAPLIAAATLFALLPDADYLVHLARGNSSRNAHRHRDMLHLPFVFIPAGLLVLYPFGAEWMFLFAAGSLAHFAHDSVGIGWGVQWLWPFRDNHYSFLYIWRPPDRREYLPRKLFYSWPHRDIESLAARYGDEEWIKNIYFRFHPFALIEYAALAAAVAALLLYW